MRTIISFSIATVLVLIAVGSLSWVSWATTSGLQVHAQDSGAKTAPLELMMNVKDLPIRQYETI